MQNSWQRQWSALGGPPLPAPLLGLVYPSNEKKKRANWLSLKVHLLCFKNTFRLCFDDDGGLDQRQHSHDRKRGFLFVLGTHHTFLSLPDAGRIAMSCLYLLWKRGRQGSSSQSNYLPLDQITCGCHKILHFRQKTKIRFRSFGLIVFMRLQTKVLLQVQRPDNVQMCHKNPTSRAKRVL